MSESQASYQAGAVEDRPMTLEERVTRLEREFAELKAGPSVKDELRLLRLLTEEAPKAGCRMALQTILDVKRETREEFGHASAL